MELENYGSVQQKISCVFQTAVLDAPSTKRENQMYKVVATETFKPAALESDIHTATATEKIDGTCVYIDKHNGMPWLWARFDRKPNKAAEKRFRKFQQQQQKDEAIADQKHKWDLTKDFKETPENWIPASGVRVVDGSPVPDDIGHTPGWVPVTLTSRQYCWHLGAVSLKHGYALVLREDNSGEGLLIECTPLSQLAGHTAELIGTNVNGNPYDIGSKKYPVHMLVLHGSIPVRNVPVITAEGIKDWFLTQGHVEGIVWHCANKQLFKVHRNHVGLPWPGNDVPLLSRRPVRLIIDTAEFGEEEEEEDMPGSVSLLRKFSGQQFRSLRDLNSELTRMDAGVTVTETKTDS